VSDADTAVVLEARGLSMAFGALTIFKTLDFSLCAGERHAVIGPNGAGKSTFVNLVTGVLRPTAGQLLFKGQDMTGLGAAQRVHAGLVRTFQINSLFPALTPLDSMLVALAGRDGCAAPHWRSARRLSAQIDEAAELLQRFGLGEAALRRTEQLSYGEQRLLEVALAMALKPTVLLLDEPAAGLSGGQGIALFEQIAELTEGTAVLFIEHDMSIVFRFADRVSVLAGGTIVASGRPDDIHGNSRVREVYLG
jgi:branched-chain amino acid transport system ATP-binding protein